MSKKRKNSKKKCLSVSTKSYKKLTSHSKKQWVSGYRRSDGTKVKRYYRRKP